MKVAIIIVHYGSLTITKKCLETLFLKEKHIFATIIVNNTPIKLSSSDFGKKECVVIGVGRNVGFAGGVNVGIREALKRKADAVLLVNNDTVFTQPILGKLIDTMHENKHIGILAPAIHFRKNGQWTFDIGGKLNTWLGRTSHTEVAVTSDKLRFVDYVSGCCMLIKKEVFEKVGLFDEKFFLYYEDVDFCLRAHKKGFAVVIEPQVSIDHYLSASAGRLTEIAICNQIKSLRTFSSKYASGLKKIGYGIFTLYEVALFTIKSKGKPYAIHAFFQK